MGIILGIIAFLIVGAIIASGVLYARQQALQQRASQMRALQQKYDELTKLYDLVFLADDQPRIVATLNEALLDLVRQMRRLEPRRPELQTLFQELQVRHSALEQGTLLPQGQRIMSTDAALTALLAGLAQTLQKLQRFKVRGMLTPIQYEEYALHLRRLALETEVESHLALADALLKDSERVKALAHLRHARDTLKKSAPDLPDRNERIRQLSDRISAVERDEPETSPADSDETSSPPEARATTPSSQGRTSGKARSW